MSHIIASFDVDAQKCFTPLCPDELPVPEGHLIAEALNQQATLADFRIGSKDAHPANAIWISNESHPTLSPAAGDNIDVYWPKHAIPGTPGFELLDGLPHPTAYDYFIWKGVEPDMHPYGNCYHDLAETLSTGIIEFLKIHQVNIVIIGGLATDYCVKNTALQLKKAGFTVILNLNACRGIAPATTQTAITIMQDFGIIIADTIQDIQSFIS